MKRVRDSYARSLRLLSTAQPQQERNEFFARHDLNARRLGMRCEIETRFSDFTRFAQNLVFPSADAFLCELKRLFLRILAEVTWNYNPPAPGDCSMCTEHCVQRQTLILLNEEMQLYACTEHGTLHRCTEQDRCPAIVVSRQHRRVCVFSGREKDILLSNAISRADFGNKAAALYMYSKGNNSRATGGFENVDRRRLPTKKSATFRPVTYRERKVAENVRDDWSRYMRVHVAGIIDRIVYDAERRRRVNAVIEERVDDQCAADLTAYVHSADQPSFVTELVVFYRRVNCVRLMPVVPLDHVERDRIAVLVLRLWELCNEAPAASADERRAKATLTQLTLAVLYAHERGFYVGLGAKENDNVSYMSARAQFVPCVHHIGQLLPSRDLLHLFSDEKAPRKKPRRACANKGSVASLVRGEAQSFLRKRRRATYESREVAENKMVSVSKMLPEHWKRAAHGNSKVFNSSDLIAGERFLRDTLSSYNNDFLEAASRNVCGLDK